MIKRPICSINLAECEKNMETQKAIPRLKNIPKVLSTDLLSLVAIVVYPCLYLYFKNINLVLFKDLVFTTLMFLLNGIVIFGIAYIFLGNVSKAFLIADISMLILLTFNILENLIIKIMPFIYFWHLVFVFLSTIALLGLLIKRKTSNEVIVKINKVTAVVFGGLILFNAILTLPSIIKNASKEKISLGDPQTQKSASDKNVNVYYFIFDEYSGLDALERYAEYDNAPFYNTLESLGFNVSPHSRNYSPSTNVEIPNLLNMSRILNESNYTNTAKGQALKYPALFRLFKENGYDINLIDDQGFLPKDVEGVDFVYSPKNNLTKVETFQTVMLKQSLYYPLLSEVDENRLAEINALFEEAENSVGKKKSNLLTFGYIMAPHLPWVVDENGNPIDASKRSDWKTPAVYLGQLKYVSNKIIELVKEIIEEDPNSVIILQSDHGLRLPIHLKKWYGEEIKDEELELFYQRNILNAVYLKGEPIDINGLSGINTLVITFNTLLEINLPFEEPSE